MKYVDPEALPNEESSTNVRTCASFREVRSPRTGHIIRHRTRIKIILS
jgi:hypothetical protein